MTLTDLTPDGVRDEALQLVAEHLAHYAVSLSPLDAKRPYMPPTAEEMRSTTLAFEVRALTHYALTGADAETDNPVIAANYARDRILSITTALDSSPWSPHEGTLDPVCGPVDAKEGWPQTGVGLACLAAWSRVNLVAGESLSAREMAALGGLSGPGSYRMIASRGDAPKAERGEVPSDEARRWLSGRGVAGF